MAEILRRVIQNIKEKTGVVSPEKTQIQSSRFSELDNELQNQHIKDLLHNSNACMGEIEFVLGVRNSDPHPDTQVVFNAKANDASRLL